jgi:hypothetical protein
MTIKGQTHLPRWDAGFCAAWVSSGGSAGVFSGFEMGFSKSVGVLRFIGRLRSRMAQSRRDQPYRSGGIGLYIERVLFTAKMNRR